MTPRNYPFKIKQIPANRKFGKITYNFPHKREPHEEETASVLARFGYDVEFIKPSKTPHTHTPDCSWRNEFWEIKSPVKNSSKTIIGAVKDGTLQSRNLVIDISRAGRNIEQAAGDVVGHIRKHRRTKIQKIMIISKERYCKIEKNMII